MGSYISVEYCKSDYGINVTCPLNMTLGTVPPNPDVAGIGIISVFIAVTSFALTLSAIDILWRIWRLRQNLPSNSPGQVFSLTEICEALVLSCSDQQVFTGGAFAISLRYWNGCSVTAYHYNIVANMLLLTCATHLISISIVRNYWRNLWQSTLRVILVSMILLVTGLFLANQDAATHTKFPTDIPPPDSPLNKTMLLFLPAACYQADSHMMTTIGESLNGTDQLRKAIIQDDPKNHIQGWGHYMAMLLWYLLALLVTYVRRFYHMCQQHGAWTAISRAFVPICFSNWVPEEDSDTNDKHRKIFKWIHTIYMLLGVVLGSVTAIQSADFIMKLRSWVQKSGWLERDPTRLQVSPEDDATSFGQQVPILLTFLTVFTAAQTVNELWDKRRRLRLGPHNAKPPGNMSSPSGSQDNKPPLAGPPDLETAAPNGTRLLHQRLWEAEGYPLLPYQPATDQTRMAHTFPPPSTMTANSTPSNTNAPRHYTVDSLGWSNFATGALGSFSPVSNGPGPQPPPSHIACSPSSTQNPSNQSALHGPDVRTGAMSEPTYFPRPNSDFIQGTAAR